VSGIEITIAINGSKLVNVWDTEDCKLVTVDVAIMISIKLECYPVTTYERAPLEKVP